jgi:hypothetical protein
MDPLFEAIGANNRGVQFLRDGRVESGIATLQQAAVVLKAFSDRVGEWPQTSSGSSSASFWFEQRPAGLKGLRSTHSSIYDRLLYVPTNPRISSQDDLEWIVLTTSASIIFNLALGWHAYGKLTGRTSHFKKAHHLYELVVTVLENAESEDESYGVLECVVLNNLAHLHYELGNYDSSRKYVTDMCDLLMIADYLDTYLDCDEADEIRFSILHLQPPTVALAA